jgi:hypothetical protein
VKIQIIFLETGSIAAGVSAFGSSQNNTHRTRWISHNSNHGTLYNLYETTRTRLRLLEGCIWSFQWVPQLQEPKPLEMVLSRD